MFLNKEMLLNQHVCFKLNIYQVSKYSNHVRSIGHYYTVKYCSRVGGESSNTLDMIFPQRQVCAFSSNAHTTYILPTELKLIFYCDLKSTN
jgi:hypothetical protein